MITKVMPFLFNQEKSNILNQKQKKAEFQIQNPQNCDDYKFVVVTNDQF